MLPSLILDLADLAHLSSAGLRVLLMVQLAMHPPGKMIVKNANETVMEIFELTGFFNLLNIE